MKKIAASELSGAALDWAVAKIQQHPWRCPWMLEKEGLAAWLSYEQAWGSPHPNYSTDWAAAGPIIEQERITLRVGTQPGLAWVAFYDRASVPAHRQRGDAPLVAAMRCFVASKLGEEIGLPEGLA